MDNKITVEYIHNLLKLWDLRFYSELRMRDRSPFIINDDVRNNIISENTEFKEIIKPIYTSRDINKYYFYWHGTRVIDINLNPKLYSKLEEYIPILSKSANEEYIKQTYQRPKKDKIIFSIVGNKVVAYLDKNNFYSTVGTNFIYGKFLSYLVAVLNSRFLLDISSIPLITEEEEEPFNELLEYLVYAIKFKVLDITEKVHVASYFESVMELLVAGILYTKELKADKCYINSDILAVLPPLSAFDEEDKEKQVKLVYKSLSIDPIIESARMRYKLIKEINPSGVSK
ncbi:hypothetical protein EW093_17135 (plasmid) [Thiospirochaeta perfilievii]|uniref:Uncharacterized protein n=1 Tax=Thiospirochaeta perfilievii TaxID=252967 RepID=A0A5C1QJU0_9SPIO|nr:hypothetical protein [Thiospirochaeta perfilievii]QEN06432.1 hypothetical protein EW093_17135 [Thiospirochaeta perfilievii]